MRKITEDEKRKILSDFRIDAEIVLSDGFKLKPPKGVLLGRITGGKDSFWFRVEDNIVENDRTGKEFALHSFYNKSFCDLEDRSIFWFTEGWAFGCKLKLEKILRYEEACLVSIVKDIMGSDIYEEKNTLYTNNQYIYTAYKGIVNLSKNGSTKTNISEFDFDRQKMIDFLQAHCFLSEEGWNKIVNVKIKNNYVTTQVFNMLKKHKTTFCDIVFV